MAEMVYAATYTMRDPQGKTVEDMFPDIFDDSEEENTAVMTDEERNRLQADIDTFSF